MSQDYAAVEPLLKMDRDRERSPAAPLEEPLSLLADQTTEVVELQVPMRVRGCEHTTGRACDRTDPGPALGQLPAGLDEAVDERIGVLGRLPGNLEQRLDRASRHPARSMLAVVAKLLDRGGKGRHAGSLTGDR